jgi:hypothetical protein
LWEYPCVKIDGNNQFLSLTKILMLMSAQPATNQKTYDIIEASELSHYMTLDEMHERSANIRRDIVNVALMNVALENSRMQVETGNTYSQAESRKMRHDFVMSHKG